MKKERLTLINNDEISIVAQDIEFGDAENYIKSRADEKTIEQVGDYGRKKDINEVTENMYNPNLQIENKKVFTIISRKDGRYLGDIRLNYLEKYNDYEIGIVIIEGERNKGYGSQAIKLLCDYTFKHLNKDKVYLRVYKNNPKAKKLYLSLGFKYVETIDDGYIINGTLYPEDILVFSK